MHVSVCKTGVCLCGSDDEEACVGRDDGLRRLSLLGAWGEGQLLAVVEVERVEG